MSFYFFLLQEITDKINEVDEVQIKTEPLSDSCVPLNPENKSDRSSNSESSSYSLTEKAFWGMSVRIKTESFSDTQELSTSHQVKNTRTKCVPSLEEEITGLGLVSSAEIKIAFRHQIGIDIYTFQILRIVRFTFFSFSLK